MTMQAAFNFKDGIRKVEFQEDESIEDIYPRCNSNISIESLFFLYNGGNIDTSIPLSSLLSSIKEGLPVGLTLHPKTRIASISSIFFTSSTVTIILLEDPTTIPLSKKTIKKIKTNKKNSFFFILHISKNNLQSKHFIIPRKPKKT